MNHHSLSSILFLQLLLLLLIPGAWPLSTIPTLAAPGAGAKVVWFRDHCLRLRDNDALDAAVRATESIAPGMLFPVYLWSGVGVDKTPSPVDTATGGTASNVFVANALDHLNQTIFGGLSLGMIDPSSDSSSGAQESRAHRFANELVRFCNAKGASEVYYMESHDMEFERLLRKNLQDHGLNPVSFGGGYSLLDYTHDYDSNQHDKGIIPWKEIIESHPFRSPLIPFVDYLLGLLEDSPPADPIPLPRGLEESIATNAIPRGDATKKPLTRPLSIQELLAAVGYTQSRTDWGSSIATAWPASEEDAAKALDGFLQESRACSESNPSSAVQPKKRTHLASRLSPYLARGLLSPKQVYHALLSSPDTKTKVASFVRRICWRDYTYAVVSLFPDVISGRPIREGYNLNRETTNVHKNESESLENSENRRHQLLKLWKDGATGFPLVDAGMRQLSKEGWMPQKVRLAVGTCLVEGLGCSWEEGMEHFAEYLVDYDPSINTNMWMNAGCVGFDPYYVGTDYKRRPYWDKQGEYVRKWCPELQTLPDSCEVPEAQRGIGTFQVDCLYEPWSAPAHVLHAAGVVLGESYPNRCCDERRERRRFFERLRNLRNQWPSTQTDDCGRDMVRLGRQDDCETIGMFTPRVLLLGASRARQ